MLALLQLRRGAVQLRAQAVCSAIRAFSEASDGKPTSSEPPLVFTRSRDSKELRYVVLKDKANPALDMLESSVREIHTEGRRYRVPPPNVCNSVLARAVEDSSLASKAAEIAEALLQRGVPLEAHTLKVLFSSLARADALPEALPVLDAWLQQQEAALVDDAGTQTPLQVMAQLIDIAVRSESGEGVLHLLVKVLARMAKIGVTPTPQSLTTLLQCFMRLGHVNVAHGVLDWMRRNNLEPNVYSYTALLAMPRDVSESAAPRLLEQALAAYAKMRQDGVPPNARFFTQLIRICGRAADMAAAEAAWADAKQAGVAPDLFLYSAMIDACAKCKDAEAALRVFVEMRRSKVRPDVVSYTSLLTALGGKPQAAHMARDIWRSMQRDGVRPNGMAIAAFLEILLLEGEMDEALQTLAAAQPGSRGGRAPSGTRWQRTATRLAKEAGLEEEAEPDLEESGGGDGGSAGQVEGRVDLPRLYEHFIFAMAHKGQYAVAEQLARHMRSRGMQHTLGTASALLTAQALQHGHTTAKWLLQRPGMGAAGSGPSAAASLPDDVVESCLLGRGSPLACMQRIMHSCKAGGSGCDSSGGGSGSAVKGVSPAGLGTDRTVANVVLGGLAVQGCTAEAVQLFDWMKQQQAAARDGSGGGTAAGNGGVACQRLVPGLSPDAWTRQLLLFAALNAPAELQLELTLRAVKEARELAARGSSSGSGSGRASGGVSGTGWDRRTRSAILTVMRQSGLAADVAAEEEREGQLQQLRGIMWR